MSPEDHVFDERDEPASPSVPTKRAEAIATICRLIREHDFSLTEIISAAVGEDADDPPDFSRFKSVRPWQENT